MQCLKINLELTVATFNPHIYFKINLYSFTVKNSIKVIQNMYIYLSVSRMHKFCILIHGFVFFTMLVSVLSLRKLLTKKRKTRKCH